MKGRMALSKDYVLMKEGLFYCPNNRGYTGLRRMAGHYDKSDERPEDGVFAVLIGEAPEWSEKCYSDYKCIEAERSSILKRLHKFAVTEAKTPMDIIKEVERLMVAREPYASPFS